MIDVEAVDFAAREELEEQEKWDTSCPDWERRLLAGESLVPELPLFEEEAERALRVFKNICVPDLANKPKMGEAAGPWIFDIVRAVFGSFNPETAVRMIQEFFVLVPKKNGKTLYAAAIMLTALSQSRRPNAEFILVAPTMKIAARAYRQCVRMIKSDPDLTAMFKPRDHINTIEVKDLTHPGAGSSLSVVAAELESITGTSATGILIDETHVFGKNPRAKQIFAEIRGALSARPDGFLIQISTQSSEPPFGVFLNELRAARAVRDGQVITDEMFEVPEDQDDGQEYEAPDSLLPVLYEFPASLVKNESWKDQKYWHLVNPNIDRSVRMKWLKSEWAKAQNNGEEEIAIFSSLHLNIEVGLGLAYQNWVGGKFWEQNGAPAMTLETLIAESELIAGGIDGGGLDDLLSAAFIGRRPNGQWLHWGMNWAHEIALERRKQSRQRYEDFKKDGDLIIVNNINDAIAQMSALFAKVHRTGKLHSIGADPYNMPIILQSLNEVGIPTELVEGLPQGWKMMGAIKTAEVKLSTGELTHAGQRIMKWAVGNAKVVPKGNAIAIDKQISGTSKIDPLVAMFDAVSVMSRAPKVAQSGWQTHDPKDILSRIAAASAALNT